MTLKTLGDVRALIEKHLPAESRARSTWKHVETLLAGAARGDEEPRDLVVALRLVFQIEGIECRPK